MPRLSMASKMQVKVAGQPTISKAKSGSIANQLAPIAMAHDLAMSNASSSSKQRQYLRSRA